MIVSFVQKSFATDIEMSSPKKIAIDPHESVMVLY